MIKATFHFFPGGDAKPWQVDYHVAAVPRVGDQLKCRQPMSIGGERVWEVTNCWWDDAAPAEEYGDRKATPHIELYPI